jgi:HK97 gp10 family phage protein
MAGARIEGLDEIVATLRALPAELVGKGGGPIREALFACAKVIRDDARARAPVDDDGFGKHMRDQIIMKRDRDPRGNGGAAERYIVTVKYREKRFANTRANRRAGRLGQKYRNYGDFYYWKFVEFGTSKMPPRSFMRAAFEANKDALVNIAREKLAAGVARIVKKMKS